VVDSRGGETSPAVAPYIGAAAAVPHGGRSLPLWPTAGATLTAVAHSGRFPWGPLPTVGPLTTVAHDGWLSDLLNFQSIV
jgi:hypothetical protein